MNLIYTGRKDSLNLTRPELEKKYSFKGKKPVEVTTKDGNYLLKEFPGSFKQAEVPVKEKKAVEPAGTDANPSDPMLDAFIEKHFPGQKIKEISKAEVKEKCLEVTEEKVILNKSKSVENMLKDFMEAVEPAGTDE